MWYIDPVVRTGVKCLQILVALKESVGAGVNSYGGDYRQWCAWKGIEVWTGICSCAVSGVGLEASNWRAAVGVSWDAWWCASRRM